MKNRPARPKWIQTQYDIIEHYQKQNKHKLSRREFMKGFSKETNKEEKDA